MMELQDNRKTLAGKAAAWSSALNLDQVPVEVVHVAKRCITDLVGVTIAGSRDPLCIKTLGYAMDTYAPGVCTIFGQPDRIGPVGAALANGIAGHVLDFDDTSYTGIMHGSTVIFPAALAAVEHAGGDGKHLLEAFIAGSEVTYSIAMLCAKRWVICSMVSPRPRLIPSCWRKICGWPCAPSGGSPAGWMWKSCWILFSGIFA